jgi:hypothetical protein
MMQEIDNTYNNLILGFAVFSFKVLAVLSMHEGLDLALTCLSIISVILLIVINFKKAWNVIFKKKEDENNN